MTQHTMIDIETLSTDTHAVILSIGVVKFNPKKSGVISQLELRPTVDDQTEKYNRHICEDTLKWWGAQPIEVQEAGLSDRDRMPLKDCMEVLYHYCWNTDRVWANGSAFDITILETAFKQTLTDRPNPIPWQYYNVRDTRTIYEVAGVKLKDKKYGTRTTHNAVEDAIHQVIVLQDAYKKFIKAGLISED